MSLSDEVLEFAVEVLAEAQHRIRQARAHAGSGGIADRAAPVVLHYSERQQYEGEDYDRRGPEETAFERKFHRTTFQMNKGQAYSYAPALDHCSRLLRAGMAHHHAGPVAKEEEVIMSQLLQLIALIGIKNLIQRGMRFRLIGDVLRHHAADQVCRLTDAVIVIVGDCRLQSLMSTLHALVLARGIRLIAEDRERLLLLLGCQV